MARNTHLHYAAHKSPPLDHILSHLNPIHVSTTCFLKTHLKIHIDARNSSCLKTELIKISQSYNAHGKRVRNTSKKFRWILRNQKCNIMVGGGGGWRREKLPVHGDTQKLLINSQLDAQIPYIHIYLFISILCVGRVAQSV
jgi:hypothetical protein